MSDNNSVEVKAIDQMNRMFEKKFAEGSGKALVDAYFVEDSDRPTVSPPGGVPPITGRAALSQVFDGQMKDIESIRLETVRLEVSSSLAYELGRAKLQVRGGPIAHGRFTVLWKKTSQGWRAAVDFFADGWPD